MNQINVGLSFNCVAVVGLRRLAEWLEYNDVVAVGLEQWQPRRPITGAIAAGDTRQRPSLGA